MVKMSILSSVCNNQTLQDVQEWMTSLLDCTSGDYELIVVDNGSSEEVEKYLQSIRVSNYCLIRNPINMGLGISTNQGFSVAKSGCLFRVDSDVIFYTYKWNELMVDWLKRFPEIGQVCTPMNCAIPYTKTTPFIETEKVVGCCQCIPRDTLTQIEIFLKTNRDKLVEHIDKILLNSKLTTDEIKRIYLVKAWVCAGQGHHDGNYMYGCDDFCYSLMLKYLGIKMAVAPEVSILHKSTSEKPELKEIRYKNVMEGFSYFRTKWALIFQALGDRDNIIMNTMKPGIFGNFDGRDFLE